MYSTYTIDKEGRMKYRERLSSKETRSISSVCEFSALYSRPSSSTMCFFIIIFILLGPLHCCEEEKIFMCHSDTHMRYNSQFNNHNRSSCLDSDYMRRVRFFHDYDAIHTHLSDLWLSEEIFVRSIENIIPLMLSGCTQKPSRMPSKSHNFLM